MPPAATRKPVSDFIKDEDGRRACRRERAGRRGSRERRHDADIATDRLHTTAAIVVPSFSKSAVAPGRSLKATRTVFLTTDSARPGGRMAVRRSTAARFHKKHPHARGSTAHLMTISRFVARRADAMPTSSLRSRNSQTAPSAHEASATQSASPASPPPPCCNCSSTPYQSAWPPAARTGWGQCPAINGPYDVTEST